NHVLARWSTVSIVVPKKWSSIHMPRSVAMNPASGGLHPLRKKRCTLPKQRTSHQTPGARPTITPRISPQSQEASFSSAAYNQLITSLPPVKSVGYPGDKEIILSIDAGDTDNLSIHLRRREG